MYSISTSAQQIDTLKRSYTKRDTTRLDSVKLDSVKLDSVKLDSVRLDSVRLDSVRLDSVRLDSVRLDSVRLDSVRLDSVRLDSVRLDSVRLDSVRLDSVRLETARLDSIRQEAIRREKIKQDSIKARTSYVPTGIRVGTDLVSLTRMLLPDGFTGWEVNADIDFNKFFLSGEFGSWGKTISSETQNYSNTGYYFRVGVDVAFFSKQRNKNIFFLGARYSRSVFDERLEYAIEDKSFGLIKKTTNSTSIEAYWGEITAGFRMKLWKGLWMGYTVRLKLEPSFNASNQLQPYDIPGFGMLSRVPGWGFNYQLFWRVGFRR